MFHYSEESTNILVLGTSSVFSFVAKYMMNFYISQVTKKRKIFINYSGQIFLIDFSEDKKSVRA